MICAFFKDQAQQVGIPARPDFNKLFSSCPLLRFFAFTNGFEIIKSNENDQILEIIMKILYRKSLKIQETRN